MTDAEIIALRRDNCRLAGEAIERAIEGIELELNNLRLVRLALGRRIDDPVPPPGATAKSDGRD